VSQGVADGANAELHVTQSPEPVRINPATLPSLDEGGAFTQDDHAGQAQDEQQPLELVRLGEARVFEMEGGALEIQKALFNLHPFAIFGNRLDATCAVVDDEPGLLGPRACTAARLTGPYRFAVI
jgi:hypothetical protein